MPHRAPLDDELSELLAIERAGLDAICAGGGGEHYRDAMSEIGVMVRPDGSVMDRADVATSLDRAAAWEAYDIADARVIRIDAETRALVYRGTARLRDAPAYCAIMTSVYARRDGSWQLALHQQTAVA